MGNINALRDWGSYQRDYVRMQWMMLQQDKAKDTAITLAFSIQLGSLASGLRKELGIILRFEGEGVNEIGVLSQCNGEHTSCINEVILS